MVKRYDREHMVKRQDRDGGRGDGEENPYTYKTVSWKIITIKNNLHNFCLTFSLISYLTKTACITLYTHTLHLCAHMYYTIF